MKTPAILFATALTASAAAPAFAESAFNFDTMNEYEVSTTVQEVSPDGTRFGLANGQMIRDDAASYTISDELEVGDEVVLRYDENNALIAVVPAS